MQYFCSQVQQFPPFYHFLQKVYCEIYDICMSGTPLEMDEVVGTHDYRSTVGRSSDGYANGASRINIWHFRSVFRNLDLWNRYSNHCMAWIYITEKNISYVPYFLFNFPIIALKICCLLWQRMCIELFDEKYKCIWSWLYLLYFQLSFTYFSIECKSLALIQKLCLPVSSHVGNFFYLPVATHGYRPSSILYCYSFLTFALLQLIVDLRQLLL